MSKRASLMLRKPGATPKPDEIEAFVRAGDEAAEPEPATPITPLMPVPPVAAVAPPTPVIRQETAPLAPEPEAMRGRAAVPADDDVPVFRRPRKSIIHRKKGTRRRTTVYFDIATARELAHYCVGREQDMSDVVNHAVRLFLDGNR